MNTSDSEEFESADEFFSDCENELSASEKKIEIDNVHLNTSRIEISPTSEALPCIKPSDYEINAEKYDDPDKKAEYRKRPESTRRKVSLKLSNVEDKFKRSASDNKISHSNKLPLMPQIPIPLDLHKGIDAFQKTSSSIRGYVANKIGQSSKPEEINPKELEFLNWTPENEEQNEWPLDDLKRETTINNDGNAEINEKTNKEMEKRLPKQGKSDLIVDSAKTGIKPSLTEQLSKLQSEITQLGNFTDQIRYKSLSPEKNVSQSIGEIQTNKNEEKEVKPQFDNVAKSENEVLGKENSVETETDSRPTNKLKTLKEVNAIEALRSGSSVDLHTEGQSSKEGRTKHCLELKESDCKNLIHNTDYSNESSSTNFATTSAQNEIEFKLKINKNKEDSTPVNYEILRVDANEDRQHFEDGWEAEAEFGEVVTAEDITFSQKFLSSPNIADQECLLETGKIILNYENPQCKQNDVVELEAEHGWDLEIDEEEIDDDLLREQRFKDRTSREEQNKEVISLNLGSKCIQEQETVLDASLLNNSAIENARVVNRFNENLPSVKRLVVMEDIDDDLIRELNTQQEDHAKGTKTAESYSNIITSNDQKSMSPNVLKSVDGWDDSDIELEELNPAMNEPDEESNTVFKSELLGSLEYESPLVSGGDKQVGDGVAQKPSIEPQKMSGCNVDTWNDSQGKDEKDIMKQKIKEASKEVAKDLTFSDSRSKSTMVRDSAKNGNPKQSKERDANGDNWGWGTDESMTEDEIEDIIQQKKEIEEEHSWDDWGEETVKVEQKVKPDLQGSKEGSWSGWDKFGAKKDEESASGGWGWTNWGVNSLLTTANAVGQGITNVLETNVLGLPDPETLAQMQLAEKAEKKTKGKPHKLGQKISCNKLEPKVHDNIVSGEQANIVIKEKSDVDVDVANNKQEVHTFGLGNLSTLVTGVSHITKIVERTKVHELGTKVITGGLDTLENIGKKTMEVLQEGDPGLKKKKAMLLGKPVLSQILREAKEKEERENKKVEEKEAARKCHFEFLFDDFQGLVHLEALEMLSRQCEIKLEQLKLSMPPAKIEEFLDTMEEVGQLCDLDEDEISEVQNFKDSLFEISSPLQEIFPVEKIIEVHTKTRNWLASDTEESPILTHQRAIQTLAELTAATTLLFHKGGELLLIKERRKTVEEADILVQLTGTLCTEINKFSREVCEKLSQQKETGTTEIIENITLEANNASSYIKQGFSLLLPVLQLGAT